MKSPIPKTDEIEHRWWVVDAEGLVLGRLATKVAALIRGKTKEIYTPHLDTGDNVIVVNASKIVVTGRKLDGNFHKHYTGYPGAQRTHSWRQVLERHPERLIEHAVKGMLPKNKLGDKLIKKLKVYAGATHPHQAQRPKELKLD